MRIALLLALVLFSQTLLARILTPAERLADLNQLVMMVKSHYGPLHYKKEKFGIDVDLIATKYGPKIMAAKDNSEFYYLLIQFIAEFKDGHFVGIIPTTHMATAGFQTDLVDNKILIDSIDRTILSEKDFNFFRGDEILEVDGRPALEVAKEIGSHISSGYDHQSLRAGSMSVAFRRGTRIPVPSAEMVTFKIRRGTSDIIENVELKWVRKGKFLDEYAGWNNKSRFTSPINLTELSIRANVESLLGDKIERSYSCNGGTRIDIPKNATVIMTVPFVAYYHPTEKGNVGYLRIPHYSPKNDQTGADEYELRYQQYAYAVSVLEKNTVGLVIDQDHNCGGSISYLEDILGLFIEKPFSPVLFEVFASKGRYQDYLEWLKEMNQYTAEYQFYKQMSDLIFDSWQKGDFLTPKTPLTGRELIYPSVSRYTKPIVVLIDENSGSGGDGFPAMMQGFGRAKLFGTRTMGLGGNVEEMGRLNYSRISINMTRSLFYRPDGVAIENNGAVPDVNYTITRDDFVYGYKNYQKAYLKELFDML